MTHELEVIEGTGKVVASTAVIEGSAKVDWVNVAVMGGSNTKLDWYKGMTVRNALDQADVMLARGAMVQVNGKPGNEDDVLKPDSVVQVTARIRNG